MSTAAYTYHDPYRLPAGLLAALVHGVFFLLLYFGVSWHTQRPEGMVVDIWSSLPEPQVAAVRPRAPARPVEPVKLPEPVKPARPVVEPKAEINLAKKKEPEIKPAEVRKPVELRKPLPQRKPAEQQQEIAPKPVQPTAAEIESARQAAAAQAAITSEIGKYVGLIRSKIRRNIVMPPDVPSDAKAEFDVVLIPGGSVLNKTLSKTSGIPAYDNAVERAIMKAQPLPLPPDVGMFNNFRELHLSFCPEEGSCSQ